MRWRDLERAAIILLAVASAITFLRWFGEWEILATEPGADPGMAWSFLYRVDGTPSSLGEELLPDERRRLASLLLDSRAMNGLLAAALVIAVSLRGYGSALGRLFCLGFGLGTAAEAYHFVREFSEFGRSGSTFLHAADVATYGTDAVALLLFYRFLRRFPVQVRLEEDVAPEAAGATRVRRLIRLLRPTRLNTGILRRLDDPRFVWPLLVVSWSIDVLGWRQRGGEGAPLGGLLELILAIIFLEGITVMTFNARRGVGDRRFEWVYLGFWYLVVLVLGASLMIALAGKFTSLPTFPLVYAGTWIGAAMGPVLPLLFAVAFFYQGTLDPRLVIRRTAVVAFLGMLTGVVFLAAERYAAMYAVRKLDLPEEWGWIIAGGVAAGAFVPLRLLADRAFKRLLDAITPPTDMAEGERVDATVVFVDLSGFTALTARDERSAIVAASLLHKTAREVAADNGGRLVKTIGDAVVLAFPESAGAVRAANALHMKYVDNSALLGLQPLQVHSGIHAGPIVVASDGDIYGATVNLAARLQDSAGPGEIVASQAVRSAVSGQAWQSLGEKTFKNVPEPVACSRLVAA